MNFLARLVSDNFRSLEKFELGHCPPATPKEKILHGVRNLVHSYLRVRFDLPSSINFRYIKRCLKIWGQEHLLWVTLEGPEWYHWFLRVWFPISH